MARKGHGKGKRRQCGGAPATVGGVCTGGSSVLLASSILLDARQSGLPVILRSGILPGALHMSSNRPRTWVNGEGVIYIYIYTPSSAKLSQALSLFFLFCSAFSFILTLSSLCVRYMSLLFFAAPFALSVLARDLLLCIRTLLGKAGGLEGGKESEGGKEEGRRASGNRRLFLYACSLCFFVLLFLLCKKKRERLSPSAVLSLLSTRVPGVSGAPGGRAKRGSARRPFPQSSLHVLSLSLSPSLFCREKKEKESLFFSSKGRKEKETRSFATETFRKQEALRKQGALIGSAPASQGPIHAKPLNKACPASSCTCSAQLRQVK